jgi:hypothetical protein
MTRETRLNLIVLAIVLAILAPGGVILFRKKLQPTLKPMAAPHAVQREHAYLSPLEAPPGIKRVEPAHTARWIEGVVRARIGDARTLRDAGRTIIRPTDRDGLPLVSEKKTFQVVAAEALESEVRVWLMLWDAEPVREETWSVKTPADEPPFRIVATLPIEVPPLVREELGETGVLRPPHEVIWQELIIPRPSDGSIRLQRESQAAGTDFVNFVPSFTNSGATRH